MFIGKRIIVNDNLEIAEKYLEIANRDEQAAISLENQKLYNQSAYFFVQAMEKQIKNHIARKINLMNKYFAEEISKTMGHSLNRSLELLIKVYCGNDQVMFEQMSQQLNKHVLKEINFRFLNNSLRYPIYSDKHGNYTLINLTKADCEVLREILSSLKKYLDDLGRVK